MDESNTPRKRWYERFEGEIGRERHSDHWPAEREYRRAKARTSSVNPPLTYKSLASEIVWRLSPWTVRQYPGRHAFIKHITGASQASVQAWLGGGVPIPIARAERLAVYLEELASWATVVAGKLRADVTFRQARREAHRAKWFSSLPRALRRPAAEKPDDPPTLE